MTQAIIVKREGAYVVTAAGAEVVASLLAQARAALAGVQPILDDLENVNTVADNITDVNTVAARDADIGTVADRDADIGTVAARDADIGTVADRDADIETVADDLNLGGSSLLAAGPDAIAAAATIGLDTGNSSFRGLLGGVDADTVTRRSSLRVSAKSKAAVANRFISEKASTMRRAVRAHGHSAIQGSGVVLAGATVSPHSGINGSLPRHLEYLLQTYDPEWSVCNHGVSAQSSSEIASRMGAIPIYITLGSGTTLASSGAVACTCTPGTWGPFARRGTSVDTLDGYIGLQLCRLTNTGTGINANSPIYSIEQIGGTASITVNPATQFTIADDSLDYAVNVFWTGRNDNNNQLSWDMQSAMVEKLPEDERRYVVMGDWNTSDGTEDTGATRLTNILAENVELRRRFGSNFFDVRAFLRGEYPYDGTVLRTCWQVSGLTASANDLADIALGRIPRVWMSFFLGGADYTHFNEVTYYWLAVALIEFHFKPKGWLA